MRTSRAVVVSMLAYCALTCPDLELRFAAGCAVFVELLELVWRLPR